MGTIQQLAVYIACHHTDIKGFTRASLFRMRQFYETYHKDPKVAPLVRQLHPSAHEVFKDTYLFDFLNLPEIHSENDLQKGLVANRMKSQVSVFCFAKPKT